MLMTSIFFLLFCSKETYQLSDTQMKKKKKAGSKARELILEQQLNQSPLRKTTESAKVHSAKVNFRHVQSHYAYNKPILPPVSKSNIQR